MSAVPKKKLCWNCEGSVARETDNCPFCGVYMHGTEEESESSMWNPSYRPSSETEDIPSPLYQIQADEENSEELVDRETHASTWLDLYGQLKRDIFPILFLMMGSIFFLFGVVLLLFSQNGTFTLQWQERDGILFLLFAAPLVGFGWKFLQQLDSDD